MLLHFFVPFVVAKICWRENWLRLFIIMMLTITVDLDHLLSDPIFDPNRCSLGFHTLHSWPAILVYLAGLLTPLVRIVASGLLIHMVLDGI